MKSFRSWMNIFAFAIVTDAPSYQCGWDIVHAQPKYSRYVFPYNPKSVSEAFTSACRILGIEDLRFHDLRHEAISRLFELGYDIHEVAQFSLHSSWEDLKRYTHLRPENLRQVVVKPSGEIEVITPPIKSKHFSIHVTAISPGADDA